MTIQYPAYYQLSSNYMNQSALLLASIYCYILACITVIQLVLLSYSLYYCHTACITTIQHILQVASLQAIILLENVILLKCLLGHPIHGQSFSENVSSLYLISSSIKCLPYKRVCKYIYFQENVLPEQYIFAGQ